MNFLQRRMVLLAAAAGLAHAAAFSHRVHLKLKLECTGCHATVATSTKVEDNNLPAKAVCLGCHKENEIAIKAPRVLFLAHFSHQQHLQLGNVAPVIAAAIDKGTYLSKPGDLRQHLNGTNPCAACHRGMEQSDAVTEAGFPRMADCLVCHAKIDPPDSCAMCHTPGPRLKPASHTPDFLDTHNNGKLNLDLESCAVCHGRKFHCLGCHR